MKRTPIQRLRATGKLTVDDFCEVCGYWRGHLIWVKLEDTDGLWYIRVNHPDGGYLYDGYWRTYRDRTTADAVAEAFRGAELGGSES
ncbi:hypothetical protein P3T40_003417 [Paraburkholderia sp. EB58]|uniref:hypothetical protein n=1 Tax=Paraburkholderia sp. EB58 TaxID=3035125 RepID=UPI003D25FFF3